MDDEDEFDYISYGTPLPDLEDEVVLRKKAAKELEVRDEKGRQRFHGAFTGGFSAGYFNTVGTKEGWAPSTFVSSRKKAADHMQQNPEDFMDEEDLGEFGIATRRIHTTSKFNDPSHLKDNKRKFSEVDSIIPGEAPLKDIVQPVRESIGIEILKKLGWKLGQGIGPRVKKDAVGTKVYGCSPFPPSSAPEEADPYSLAFTFAPKDAESQTYEPKDDVFGLGYTGLSKESILGSHIDLSNPTFTKSFLKKDKKKLTISGQAFGVGAFEDDDEDIYSKDDMSQYDFSDLGMNNKQKASHQESKRPVGADAVLVGFCLASKPPPTKTYYPPPNLPRDFKPIRSSMPKLPVLAEPKSQFASRHSMSAEGRSLLLGENKFESFKIAPDKKMKEKRWDTPDRVKTTSLPSSSKHSFRPFPNDPQKQQRYEEYLNLKEMQEVDKLIQPPSMTEWEKQQEIEEFARAAVLFKPLSAALSSKFESKSHLSVEHDVMDAIAKSRKENEVSKTPVDTRKLVGLSKRTSLEWHPASLLCKRFNVPNPYPNSTEVSGSQKSKSLFDHISFENIESSPSVTSYSNAEAKSSTISDEESSKPKEITTAHKEAEVKIESISVSQNVLDPTLNTKKPPIDFFKDIFENSSSDEEESPKAEPTEEPPGPSPSQALPQTDSTVVNPRQTKDADDFKIVKENRRVGFGVFANLDLDALNQRTPLSQKDALNQRSSVTQKDALNPKSFDTQNSDCKVASSKDERNNSDNVSVPIDDSPVHDKTLDSSVCAMEVDVSSANTSAIPDLYGPELPPNFSVPSNTSPTKSEVKKHSKHKSKHKHKHHKHKSKKKKKKHSSDKSLDDSSFGSDEDIPPTVIIEKLKKLQKVMKSGR